jgi:site-specific DNA recombinase
VFLEAGESAKTQDRPQFQEMLAYCKANRGRVGFVVVNDLSRFSRQMEDQVAVIADLEAVGVRLRSVSENVDETAAGKLMRNIHGAFNQFDNDRKAERTRTGMQRSASIGRFPFKAPLGYLNVSVHRGANLMPDPVRGPLVAKAFELYGQGTVTRTEVLRKNTTLGLRTRKEEPLTPQSFQKLLRNPIYAGHVCIPSWGFDQKGGFEPLVSEKLFNRVQELLDGRRPSATPHDRNNPDFPLRVFVRCGTCGQGLTGAWSSGRSKRYPYYRCRATTCKSVNIRKEELEKQFVALLERLSPQQGLMRLFVEAVKHVWEQRQQDSQAAMRSATRRLANLSERKNKLVDANLDGRIDQQTYEEQVERLRGEVELAKNQFRDADVETLDVKAVLEFAERLVSDPAQLWIEASLDQKQRLQAVFFPEGVTFTNQGFGTGATNSFFDMLQVFSGKESHLASPTGFEPVLSPGNLTAIQHCEVHRNTSQENHSA